VRGPEFKTHYHQKKKKKKQGPLGKQEPKTLLQAQDDKGDSSYVYSSYPPHNLRILPQVSQSKE
jgi:hypothetical protein